jgi:hypothetical protein
MEASTGTTHRTRIAVEIAGGNSKDQPECVGRAGLAKRELGRIDIDDPARPGAQDYLVGHSMAASDIGICAPNALNRADTVKSMLTHNGSAFAAADPVNAYAVIPVLFRIPPPAELEAELVAAMAMAPLLCRIKLPVGFRVPPRFFGQLDLALVFILLDAALFDVTLVFLIGLIIRFLHLLRAASVRMLRAVVPLFAVGILCACQARRSGGH